MDRKKQKMVAKTWRPLSTQSKSTEGDLGLGDEKHDFGGQVQEIKYTVSSYESTVMARDGEAEVVIDVADTTRIPKAVQDSEGIDLEGQTASSAVDESLSAAQKHSVTVKAGASLMRFIRGKGGATQRTIEEEMRVKVILPLSRKEDYLIIEGNSAESVARASDRVQAVIDETVKSRNLDYSHFVSLHWPYILSWSTSSSTSRTQFLELQWLMKMKIWNVIQVVKLLIRKVRSRT